MGVCQLTHVISLISLSLIQLRPYSRVRRADRGIWRWTGATPSFRCPNRARRRCAIYICATPPGGSLPSHQSLAGRPEMTPLAWRRCAPRARAPTASYVAAALDTVGHDSLRDLAWRAVRASSIIQPFRTRWEQLIPILGVNEGSHDPQAHHHGASRGSHTAHHP